MKLTNQSAAQGLPTRKAISHSRLSWQGALWRLCSTWVCGDPGSFHQVTRFPLEPQNPRKEGVMGQACGGWVLHFPTMSLSARGAGKRHLAVCPGGMH